MKWLKITLLLLVSTPTLAAEQSPNQGFDPGFDQGTENFGRLFTSPQERRALDELRRTAPRAREEGMPFAPEQLVLTTDPDVATQLKFSGYVKRSDGQYVLWVNGVSTLSNSSVPVDHAYFQRNSSSVLLQTGGYRATMQPGQVWSLDDNTVVEGYLSTRKPEL
tara:strand:+ start:85389 stop:85880 length:492 start_codon:yes stop_codon:yes gene_type:complete